MRRRQRVAALFKLIGGAELSPELTSHYARYLCVQVSGNVEQAMRALIGEYCRLHAAPPIERYVAWRSREVRNLNRERLGQILQGFDPSWWSALEDRCGAELDAFSSLVALRNRVAHGEDTGATVATMYEYFQSTSRVMDELSQWFSP
ncbi:MAG: HEPN domain-containing protein [Candidatus Dormibacteria bacterium]